MAIEKWRPAKAGDEGLIARFRYAYDGHWRVGTLEGIRIDDDVVQVTEFYNGFDWFLHCEVLEAYMSDKEVFQLEHAISEEFLDEVGEELHGGLTRMRIGQIIRETIERGE